MKKITFKEAIELMLERGGPSLSVEDFMKSFTAPTPEVWEQIKREIAERAEMGPVAPDLWQGNKLH